MDENIIHNITHFSGTGQFTALGLISYEVLKQEFEILETLKRTFKLVLSDWFIWVTESLSVAELKWEFV